MYETKNQIMCKTSFDVQMMTLASCQGWIRLRVKVTALYVTKNEVSEYIGKGFMRNYQTLNKKYQGFPGGIPIYTSINTPQIT